jgi:hypothetical protein
MMMNELIIKIDNFIEKQVKFRSPSEMAQYGVKLPPESKFEPLHSEYKPRQPKSSSKVYKPRKPKIPGEEVIGEVGRQISPKGPYRSPQEIVEDVKEAERLARKITGIKKPGD